MAFIMYCVKRSFWDWKLAKKRSLYDERERFFIFIGKEYVQIRFQLFSFFAHSSIAG